MYSNNYFQAPTQPPRQPSYQLKGRPVSSLEEARALSIDFDGSVFYFPDLANKKIYTKQINMDGTATLNMYELKPMPVAPTTDYITRAEFESALLKIQELVAQPRPSAPTTTPTKDAQTEPAPYKF